MWWWNRPTLRDLVLGLHRKVDAIMAKELDLETLISDIDAATNAVATKLDAQTAQIQALKDQIAAGTPVSQAQLDALAANLTTERDRLRVLGADASNPVPPTT